MISRKKKKKNFEKLECVICELLAVDLGNLDEIDLFVDFFFLVLLCVLEDIDLLFFFCATRVIPSMSK